MRIWVDPRRYILTLKLRKSSQFMHQSESTPELLIKNMYLESWSLSGVQVSTQQKHGSVFFDPMYYQPYYMAPNHGESTPQQGFTRICKPMLTNSAGQF